MLRLRVKNVCDEVQRLIKNILLLATDYRKRGDVLIGDAIVESLNAWGYTAWDERAGYVFTAQYTTTVKLDRNGGEVVRRGTVEADVYSMTLENH
jgi:hypothetical protein